VPPELDLPAHPGDANSERSPLYSGGLVSLALGSRRCPRSTATASGV
jgi:hypothetical protein